MLVSALGLATWVGAVVAVAAGLYFSRAARAWLSEAIHTARCVVLVCRYLAPRIAGSTEDQALARVANSLLDDANSSKANGGNGASAAVAGEVAACESPVDGAALQPSWDALHKELLQAVFSSLESSFDRGNARLVSKTWREAITEVVKCVELPVMMPDEAAQQLLTRLPDAFSCATHLVLNNNQTCHPDVTRNAILQVAACSQIKALDLRDSQYWTTRWDLSCVSALTNLTSLSLSFQVVERTTAQGPHSGTGLSIASECAAISQLMGLQQLRVWFMAADDEGQYLQGDFFRSLAALPRLHTLTVNCALISDEEVRHILHITALRSLTLYGAFLGPNAIESLACAPHLKRLELSQNIDSDAAAPDQAPLPAPLWNAANAAAHAAAGGGNPQAAFAAAIAAAMAAANGAVGAAAAANNAAGAALAAAANHAVAGGGAAAAPAAPAAAAAAPAAPPAGAPEEGPAAVPGSELTYLQLPLTAEALRLGPMVPHMTALRRLFVQEPLRQDAVRPFSQSLPAMSLPPLQELFIDGFIASDPGPLEALANLTSLTSLTLCNTSLPSDLFSQITVLSTLTAIEDFVLDLEDPSAPAPISDTLISNLAGNWHKLVSLHLDAHVPSPNPVGGPNVDPDQPAPEIHLSAFSSLTTLQNLSIHHTGTAFVFLSCASLPPTTAALNAYGIFLEEPYLLPPTLRHLRISYCSFHPSDIYVLSRHLTALRTLMVKKDSRHDPHPLITAANLPLLTNLTSLQSLALSITGHQPISALSTLTGLTRLLLDQDGGEASMVATSTWYSELMQLTTLTRLRSLWLSGNFVDPQAAEDEPDDNNPTPSWAGYDVLLRWQNQLQRFMPLCVLQLVENDRFWTSDIIMNEAVDWWACSAWPSHEFSDRESPSTP